VRSRWAGPQCFGNSKDAGSTRGQTRFEAIEAIRDGLSKALIASAANRAVACRIRKFHIPRQCRKARSRGAYRYQGSNRSICCSQSNSFILPVWGAPRLIFRAAGRQVGPGGRFNVDRSMLRAAALKAGRPKHLKSSAIIAKIAVATFAEHAVKCRAGFRFRKGYEIASRRSFRNSADSTPASRKPVDFELYVAASRNVNWRTPTKTQGPISMSILNIFFFFWMKESAPWADS